MWVGNSVYFLSDRNGPVTLFAYDLGSRAVREVVKNDGLDIGSASAGPGAIVYEQFGSLHLLDLASGQDATVAVRLAADMPQLRPHFLQLDPVKDILARRHLADRPARGLRGARRDRHGAGREGGHPRHHQHGRRGGARSGVVARRHADRVLLRRVGRVRAVRASARTASARSRRSTSAARRRSSTRRRGRPTARRSPTATSGSTSGSWTSSTRRRSRWTPTASTRRIRSSTSGGRRTAAGSPTPSSCRASCAPCSSTRSPAARPSRSPTA